MISTGSMRRRGCFAAAVAMLAVAGFAASDAAAQTRTASTKSGFGSLGSSKEPIKIDADRLEVFDKEGRAVFSGNVIAVQGDSTMKCTAMNVIYEGGRAGGLVGQSGAKDPAKAEAAKVGAVPAATPAAAPGGLPGGDAIKKIECAGPVTITSKTQTATGDRAEYDRVRKKVFLIGNAALMDGPNVTKGDRVAYDLDSGVARVEGGGATGGRVRALITPSGGKDAPAGAPKPR